MDGLTSCSLVTFPRVSSTGTTREPSSSPRLAAALTSRVMVSPSPTLTKMATSTTLSPPSPALTLALPPAETVSSSSIVCPFSFFFFHFVFEHSQQVCVCVCGLFQLLHASSSMGLTLPTCVELHGPLGAPSSTLTMTPTSISSSQTA
jgi:hypothetical protein